MDISHGIISRDHISVINPATDSGGSGGGNNGNGSSSTSKTENLIVSPKSEIL